MKKVTILLLILLLTASTAYAKQYTAVGSVTAVSGDLVEVTTTEGETFSFEESGWNLGETCIMLMSDNFTTDPTDDIIVVQDHYWGDKT